MPAFGFAASLGQAIGELERSAAEAVPLLGLVATSLVLFGLTGRAVMIICAIAAAGLTGRDPAKDRYRPVRQTSIQATV